MPDRVADLRRRFPPRCAALQSARAQRSQVDALASGVSPRCLVINDAYYNHCDADRDINCIFPIERLRELAAEGIIGAVAPNHYSGFMGRIYTRSAVTGEAAPALARRLQEEQVDAAALVPA